MTVHAHERDQVAEAHARRGRPLFLVASLLALGACSDEGGTSSSSGGGSASSGETTSSPTGASVTSSTTNATGGGGGPPTCSGKTGVAGDRDYDVMVGDLDRTFRVHAPPSYDPTSPHPVVFVFHGYTETASQIEDISKMTPEADGRGYLVVYAEGINTGWNAGACCGSAASMEVDDIGFVVTMLDTLESDYCIDERRVFSSGFSNGGMLSHRLACELSDRIAAIGPVAGTMAIDPCVPSRAVPVMSFHGTSDPVVSYSNGGFSGADGAVQTATDWAARNGCASASTVTFQQGDAECETWTGCDAGADVTLCTLTGGGHQWPGGNSAGPGGTINMDIFASAALLDFFDEHPMP